MAFILRMQYFLNYYKNNPTIAIALAAALALTFLTSLSLYLNISNLRQEKINLATQQAKDNWNKDQAFRVWATRHGGFYVKPDESTPPNPYLAHIKKRDIVTSDGEHLTLMNPAYMMRQMATEFDKLYGIKGKITGKILLNPVNKPDDWELSSLSSFEQGIKEVVQEAEISGKPYLRYMKPMFMTKGCVKCHGHLGFKIGDLRGGVSISIPLSPYFKEASKISNTLISTHAIVWLLGIIFIIVFYLIVSEKSQENRALIKRLELNAKRLQNSLNAAHAGTINYDLIQDIIYWDSAAADIYGLEKVNSTHSYQEWRNLIHPDDVDSFDQQIRDIIDSKQQRLRLEFRTNHKETELRWVKLWCNIFRDDKGKAHSLDGIMLDISSEKLNEQVLQEKEAAERFAHKQSTFLTNMSHEFRTPLHGILSFSKIGLTRIKENQIEASKFNDFFSSINISANRLLNLLNDLLDLAKLEAEQMIINRVSNDLYSTTKEILKEQRFLIEEKGIQINLNTPLCQTTADFDKARMTQVITNLLSNAIKFTERQGKIVINFKADTLTLTGQQSDALCFTIHNTGKGIPGSELESIFDKFIQSSRNDPGASGTGLGLAICREIIEAHEGKIWAEQHPQGGAIFSFVIPYTQAN